MNFYAVPLLFISYSILFFAICHCQELYPSFPSSYEQCRAGKRCGNSILKYPFYCVDVFGLGFQVYCSDSDIVIRDSGLLEYRIVDDLTESSYVNHTITLRVTNLALLSYTKIRKEILESIPTGFHLSHEHTINGTLLHCDGKLLDIVENNTQLNSTFQLLTCPFGLSTCTNCFCYFSHNFTLNIVFGSQFSVLSSCTSYGLIVPKNYNIPAMQEDLITYLLNVGFRITWTNSVECQSCETSLGICAIYKNNFVCVCPDGMHKHNYSDGQRIDLKRSKSLRFVDKQLSFILGISLGVAFLSVAVVRIDLLRRKLRKSERNNLDLRAYMDSIDPRPASTGLCVRTQQVFLSSDQKIHQQFQRQTRARRLRPGFQRKASQRISGGRQTFGQVETEQTAILERSGDHRENPSLSFGTPLGILFSEIQTRHSLC
eukprot:Gb_06874 [translate_table: standard]